MKFNFGSLITGVNNLARQARAQLASESVTYKTGDGIVLENVTHATPWFGQFQGMENIDHGRQPFVQKTAEWTFIAELFKDESGSIREPQVGDIIIDHIGGIESHNVVSKSSNGGPHWWWSPVDSSKMTLIINTTRKQYGG